MGTEWVSELSTHNTGVEEKSSAPISYQKLFDEACPIYMSFGMSYDEFWYGDPKAARFYRQAYVYRKKQINEQLWLQGMYFYEALCDVAPVLVSMPKKDAKIQPYSNEPYAITARDKKDREQRELERSQKAAIARFEALATVINHKFNKGGDNGGSN